MIVNGLIFLLGALLATFLALLLIPLVWRKAQKLARRDFEATIPNTANELRAEADFARAEAALAVRRQEVLAAETRERAARERAEAGRIAARNAELTIRGRVLDERIAQQEEELQTNRALMLAREAENQRLAASLHETKKDLNIRSEELEALATRFRDLTEIAEERKVHIVALETKLDRLSDDLRSSERRARELQDSAERLRSDVAAAEASVRREKAHALALDEKLARLTGQLADRDDELGKLRGGPAAETGIVAAAAVSDSPAEPEPRAETRAAAPEFLPLRPFTGEAHEREEEELRERISDIAAQVIRMTAIAEGPNSPLPGLLAGQPPGGRAEARVDGVPVAGDTPSLADRVRVLMDADRGADGKADNAADQARARAE